MRQVRRVAESNLRLNTKIQHTDNILQHDTSIKHMKKT